MSFTLNQLNDSLELFPFIFLICMVARGRKWPSQLFLLYISGLHAPLGFPDSHAHTASEENFVKLHSPLHMPRVMTSRCKLLRGQFLYDFEVWTPRLRDWDSGEPEFIQPRDFHPQGIFKDVRETMQECGTLSAIPWCVYQILAEPRCSAQFLYLIFHLRRASGSFEHGVYTNDTENKVCLNLHHLNVI